MFDKTETTTVTASTDDELNSALTYLIKKKRPFQVTNGQYGAMKIKLAKFHGQELQRRLKKVRAEKEKRQAFRQYAREQINQEGDLEFDKDAMVSLSDEDGRGAYVECWKWIDQDDVPSLRG